MATFEVRESSCAMVNDLHPDHGGRPEIVIPAEDEGEEGQQISMTALWVDMLVSILLTRFLFTESKTMI